MSVDFLRLASFLVALTVALGAIPFARAMQTRLGADDPDRPLPGIGGYALVMGLFIATFYVSILPTAAIGLGQATLIALLLAAADHAAASTLRVPAFVRTTIRTVVILIVTLTLLAPESLVSNLTNPSILLLVASLTALPLAIAKIGVATERTAPCRTTYLFYIMIIGLLILSGHSVFTEDPGPPAIKPILTVLTPLLGALLACLFYMTDMPWRPGNISMGHGGHFILGFALSWAALLVGSTTSVPSLTAIAMTFIVAGPIYSALARWFLHLIGWVSYKPSNHALNHQFRKRRAVFDYASTLSLVSLGVIVMYGALYWVVALMLIPLSIVVYTIALAVVEGKISQSSRSFDVGNSHGPVKPRQSVGRS